MTSSLKEPAQERTRFLRNASLNFAGQAVSLLIGLASLPVVVRGLGPQRFALFSLALLVLGNTTLLDVGLGRATTKLLAAARYQETDVDLGTALWTSLVLHGALGIVGAILMLLATPILVDHVLRIPPTMHREATLSFVVVAAAIPLVLIGSCVRGALEALLRFDIINAVKVPASALLYLAPVVLIVAGYGLVAIMVAAWFSRGAIAIAYARALTSIWPGLTRARPSRALARELLSFGGWVSVANVAAAALGYMDRFVIGALLSLTLLGYYSASSDAVGRLLILPTSVVVALFPAFSGLSRDRKEDLSDVFGLSVKVLLFVLLPITALLIAYAPEVLRTWLGAEYAAHAVVVFDILLVGALVNSLGWIPYAFLQAHGRPDLPAKVLLYETPLFALGLLASVSAYGITGAAAAWAFRVTGEVVVFFWLAGRVQPSVLHNLRRAARPGAIWQASLLPVLVLARLAVFRGVAPMGAVTVGLGLFVFLALTWRHFFDAPERLALAGFLTDRPGRSRRG